MLLWEQKIKIDEFWKESKRSVTVGKKFILQKELHGRKKLSALQIKRSTARFILKGRGSQAVSHITTNISIITHVRKS